MSNNATVFLNEKKKDIAWLNELKPGVYSHLVLLLYEFAAPQLESLMAENKRLKEEIERTNAAYANLLGNNLLNK